MAARRNVTRDIDVEYDEHAVTITPPEREAAGVRAVMVALQRGLKFMGVFRTASLLPRLNQRTGFDCPIVDAGMRQLHERGFMHNRVRMIVASLLVKDLHLPWQWGARWFLEQLVDGDMANDQHGWQWCAGSGTDAAPYFRVFNPKTQGEKFDPAGDYVRRWVPELAEVDDAHLKSDHRPPGYPAPIVDHGQERQEALRRYQRSGGN